MQPGDIVLTVARHDDPHYIKMPRAVIQAGQWIKSKMFKDDGTHVPIVHAAIAVDQDHVIESVGEGVVLTRLSTEKHKRSALIYSVRYEDLAAAAVLAANQFHFDSVGKSIEAHYSVWKAMLSIFKRTGGDPSLQARINESVSLSDGSFCSQFVANCFEVGNLYISANLQPPPARVFSIASSAITPWELATQCDVDSQFFFSGFWEDGVEVRL